MIHLSFQYPMWSVFLCPVIGFVFAYFLYRKENRFNETSKIYRKLMFAFRFFSITLISLLLTSPFLKITEREIEKPIVIFAQDNSESISKSSIDTKKYLVRVQNMLKLLGEKYDIRQLSFGEKIRPNSDYQFNEKETDISEVFRYVQNTFYNRNVGAVILASDGIYNKGSDPVYSTTELPFPVYCIGVGDTAVKKDLILSNVRYNKIAFLNNKFPVQSEIFAKKLKGKSSELKVYEKGKLIYNEKFIIDNNEFYKKINFEIEAQKSGIAVYQIILSTIEGEFVKTNNAKEIFVEILDSKRKILILANAPHPDIAAFREAADMNFNFETEFYTLSNFSKNVSDYNLIVLYQIPTLTNRINNLLSDIYTQKIPVLYVLGTQSSLSEFNKLKTGISVYAKNSAFDEVQATVNKNFTLFEINPEYSAFLKEAPPLISPFADYKVDAETQTLFFRKINSIETATPLITLNSGLSNQGVKSGVITGEGIWKWRLIDYKLHDNHLLFNELINKIIQYLTLVESKERFRVSVDKIISENQNVMFSAEIYNKSYEQITVEDVNLSISDSSGKDRTFMFEKTAKSYTLNVGNFLPGEYHWNAQTQIDGGKAVKKGIFRISPLQKETENMTADFKTLLQLAKKSGGKFVGQTKIDSINQYISLNENIVPLAHYTKNDRSLLNYKWLFLIILIFLSGEWFLRKYFGAY